MMNVHITLESMEQFVTFYILQVGNENMASEKRVHHTVILILKSQGDVERFVGRQYFYEVFRHKDMGRVVFNITIPKEKGYAEIPVSPHEFPFNQRGPGLKAQGEEGFCLPGNSAFPPRVAAIFREGDENAWRAQQRLLGRGWG